MQWGLSILLWMIPLLQCMVLEAAGLGLEYQDFHALTFAKGRPGVLHGALMDVLQDENGQILEAFSISAGLDYPGIGPEHSYFNAIDRATYVSVTDEEAIEGFKLLSRLEGIIPALESSHAIAYLPTLAKELCQINPSLYVFQVEGIKMLHKFEKGYKQKKRRTNMTKTLQVRLQEIKNAQKGIFIPYIMAGDHNQGLDGLFETIQFLEQSGVSAIEIGVPFSDPVADACYRSSWATKPSKGCDLD